MMNIGYPASKNRHNTTAALTEEQAFRLRRMAAEDHRKLSPFIGQLIDREWERRREASEQHQPDSEAA